jgi:heme oxygenase
MRTRITDLHTRAERTGIVAAIQAGQATRTGYALYLRNLLPAYQTLESALQQHRDRPGIGYLAQESLYRAERIHADLDALAGTRWAAVLPLLPSGERYAERVEAASARAGGALLLAHAYTRYLGDLNGGRMMRGLLLRLFGPDFNATAFTEFPDIAAPPAFVAGFRAALDEAGAAILDLDRVVEETAIAFELNIQVSEEAHAFR